MSKKVKDKVGYLVDGAIKNFLDTHNKPDSEVFGMKINQLLQDKEGKLYLVFELEDVVKKWATDDKV